MQTLDKQTANYRSRQLACIERKNEPYKATIKIVAGNGNATNYLDISDEELQQIINILAGIKA